jgi:large subunit ribosomal protein L15
MPLQRRIPKRGFRSRSRVVYQLVNIRELEKWDREASLDPEAMVEAGLIRKAEDRVKVLGDGELTHPVRVKAHKFSRQASEKIKLAGGVAEVIKYA